MRISSDVQRDSSYGKSEDLLSNSSLKMRRSNLDSTDRALSHRSSLSSIVQALTDPNVNPILPQREATLLGSTINMANTVLGAGLLGLPYAFANAGWIFGSLFLILGLVFSFCSCYLLSLCAAKSPHPASFYTVAKTVNPLVTDLIDMVVFLGGFGTCCAYLIVIGDLMPPAAEQLGASDAWQGRERWVFLGFFFSAPLSLFHNLDGLKYTSAICALFLIIFAGAAFTYAVDSSLDPCSNQQLDDDSEPCIGKQKFISGLSFIDVFKVFSIVVFAYGCQANVFPIVNELERVTIPRLNIVFFAAIAFSGVLYGIVAASGYITYGESVQPDILKSYPASPMITACRIMISLVVAFSYPLQINPARRCFLTILENWYDSRYETVKVVTIRYRYIAVTSALLLCSLLVALIVEDLGVVLSLVGATGSVLLTFILPGWFYLHLYPLREERLSFDSEDDASVKEDERALSHSNSLVDNSLIDTLLTTHFSDDFIGGIEPPPADIRIRYLAKFMLIFGIILTPLAIITIFI